MTSFLTALFVGVLAGVVIIACARVGSGYAATRLGFKPWMWSAAKRERLIRELCVLVRAGGITADAADATYMREVGMDHLTGAFGPKDYERGYAFTHLMEAQWEYICVSCGWRYKPLHTERAL